MQFRPSRCDGENPFGGNWKHLSYQHRALSVGFSHKMWHSPWLNPQHMCMHFIIYRLHEKFQHFCEILRKKNFIQEQSSRMVRPQQTENVFHIFLEFPANEEFHVWCSNMSFLQEFSRIVSTAHKSFTSPEEQCTKIIFLRFLSSASLFPTSQLLLLLIMTFILMFYFCFCLRSF